MNFLLMSISGSIIILIVLLIRATASSRLTKKIFLYLWRIVLFRLLVPFSIPAAFNIFSLFGQSNISVSGNTALNSFEPESVLEEAPSVIGGISSALNETTSVSDSIAEIGNSMTAASALFLIWCAGAAFFTFFFTIAWLRCRFEFRASLPVNHPFTDQWQKELSLKRTISIRQSDKIDTPLTYGIFRPVILLPKKTDFTDTVQLQYILLHEYVHIFRFDALMKFVSAAALCIHWFNPLVWIMYSFLNRDIELACDESVVRYSGMESRSVYAGVLLNMEARKSSITPFCSNFNKNAIQERIISIMKIKMNKISISLCILVIALVLFAAIFFSTSATANTGAAANETTSVRSDTGSENTVVEAAADSDYNPDEFLPASKADFTKEGELLHTYEQFGISYDADGKFYYNGQPVRYFWDGAEVKEDNEVIGWTVRYEYLNEEGTVDVHTIRKTEYNVDNSINICGPVTGMQQASNKEFEALDIKSLLDPNRTAVAEETATFDSGSSDTSVTSDDTIVLDTDNSSANDNTSQATEIYDTYASAADTAGGRTFSEIFAEYAPYGITYTEKLSRDGVTRNLFFNGQPVQSFSDISGETAFSFSTDIKGLHVQAIRDKNGELIGVEPVS